MSQPEALPVVQQRLLQKNISCWLALFGLLIFAISWGFTLLEIQRDRSGEITQAQREAGNLAVVLEKHVFGGFSQIEASLASIRQIRESGRDSGSIHTLLKHLHSSRSDLFNLISIINTNGDVVLTDQDSWKPTNSGDRPFFIYHRDNPERKALIGTPLLGRVTGKWYIPVSLRLQDVQGRFAGVLLASVNPEYFSSMFAKIDLGPSGLIYLADGRGQIFSGVLEQRELSLDSRISPDAAEEILKKNLRNIRDNSAFDSVERIAGRSTLRDRPMYISVEIGLDGRLEKSRQRTFVLLLIQVVFSLLVLFFLFRLRKEIKARDAFSLELARTGEALRTSEEFRRRVFESSHVAVVIMDANTLRYVDCNPAAVKVGGYASKEEMLRQTPAQHADLPQYDGTPSGIKARHYIERAKKEGSVDFEWLHKRPNGELWDAQVHLMLFRSGERELMQFTLHDITAQKRAEAGLREKEAELQRYFDYSLDLLCIADTSGRFLRLNPEWEKTLGYTLQELQGRPFLDLVHPEDRYATVNAIAQLERQEEVKRFENRYQCKDGSYRWIEWRSKPIGKLIYAAARDITERKQTEQNLLLFRELVDHASDAIGVSTPQGRHYYQNEAFDEWFGDIGEDPVTTLYFEQAVGRDVFDNIMSGKNWRGEIKAHAADGSLLDIFLRAYAVKNDAGEVIALVGLHTDITQYRLTVQALKESEEQYRNLFEHMHSAFIVFEVITDSRGQAIDHRLIQANPEFERMTGLKCSEQVGRTSSELSFEWAEEARQRYYDIALQGGSVHWERFNESLQRYYDVRAFSPRPGQFAHLFDDITQRKQAEAQLERLNQELEARVEERTTDLAQANRQLQEALNTLQHAQDELVRNERLASLGALVAGVAHELNTPLGNSYTIATTLQEVGRDFLETFERGELKRSTLKRYVEQFNEAAGLMTRNLYRASEMITHFKQVTADQTSAQRRCFELHECVDEILTTLQPQFKRTTHKITVDVPEGLLFDSYPGPLGQIITNIVLNALMHAFEGRENGIIHIEAVALENERVRMVISDNGCGIAAKNLPRIFDPFFTTRLGTGGSGLGLHIVYSIVTRVLGGKVRVDSVEGEGCAFCFEIPMVAPESALQEEMSETGSH